MRKTPSEGGGQGPSTVARHDTRVLLFTADSTWTLEALIEAGFHVVGVVCPEGAPWEPGRRGPRWWRRVRERLRRWRADPEWLEIAALSHWVRLYWYPQPPGAGLLARLRHLRPHVLAVAGFPFRLPWPLVGDAAWGGLNIHASWLPDLRGPQPTAWALRLRRHETGVTVHRLTDEPDAGPILLQTSVHVYPYDTVASLAARQFQVGADLLIEAIDQLRRGSAVEFAQDESEASYYPRMPPREGRLDWSLSSAELLALGRLAGWLSLYTESAGQVIEVGAIRPHGGATLRRVGRQAAWVELAGAAAAAGPTPPGTVLGWAHGHALVATGGGGAVWIGGLQPRRAGARLRWRLRGPEAALPPGSRLG